MAASLLAARARNRTGSNIFAAATALAQRAGSVNLGQGFPSFETPEFARRCVAEALADGHNQYARPGGHPVLTQALSKFYSPLYGRTLDPMTEITVCSGAQEGIYNLMATFVDEGDQVLCIEPYFDAYKKAADLVGAHTTGVPLRFQAGKGNSAAAFKLDLDELEAKITDKTKLLIINTPHNPTGKMFSREELEGIAEVVRRHPRLLVLSDEVYEFMCFDGLPHERFSLLNDMWDRTITCFSAGKTFSCTGWRVGYMTGPGHLIEPIMQTQSIVSFCTPTPLQVGIARAFEAGTKLGYFAKLADTLEAKRNALCEGLALAGLMPIVPQGGYFVMADTSRLPVEAQHQRDVKVNEWLTLERGVTGIPTSYFYSAENMHLADNTLRFAYCKTDDEIEKAIAALKSHASP